MKESVKIDSKIVDRIRRHIKKTGQTISGYIDITLAKDLDEKESYVTVSEYVSGMAPALGKAINATRKNKRK
jgi:hypothetical protein